MIPVLFNILFFLIPLIFFKNTSELFEFNKIITLYGITILITCAWAVESIKQRKLLFRRTILDIPLLIYLSILILSSLLSIDPRTSVFGYYSRFNGGLLSQFCYALLYWAFVSNLTSKQSIRSVYYILVSTAIASILAILEHFGVFSTCGLMKFGWTKSCWVQDVQSRVFSTLGQPNWLGALLVALIPLTWIKYLNQNKTTIFSKLAFGLLSIVFFVTLLFTKSRSGILAFGIEAVIFWSFQLWKEKGKYLKEFLILFLISAILFFAFNSKVIIPNTTSSDPTSPVLETGGTESGMIRKYVWLGAFNVFKHYPILGTGPETFAFSFPMYKPVDHNLTSEWDFIYNKAHNEFLSYLANTGLLGFIAYLSLIVYSINIIFKSGKYEYLAGYIAILVSNFFGFSVVPVSLLFFLIPALALIDTTTSEIHLNKTKLKLGEKFSIIGVLIVTSYLLFTTYNYWIADINYNKARVLNRSNKSSEAIVEINKAIKFSPNEAVYISELALADSQVDTALKALDLSSYNQNVRKILISNLVKNSGEKPNNLLIAEKVLNDGILKAPNDPKLYYQLGILQLKITKNNEAIKNFQKAIELKPNYKEGRFALGATYKDLDETEKAKRELDYILKYIDPNDELTKKYLDEINFR